jgi:hypothetical protein
MAYLLRVAVSERSRPEIFCWVFDGRRSRSALCRVLRPHKADYAATGVMWPPLPDAWPRGEMTVAVAA